MNRQGKGIILLVILAVIIRIVVVVWALQMRENTDVLRYRDWGKISYLYSLSDTYKPDHLSFGTLPNNQPPGSTYIIAGAYQLNILIAKIYLKLAGNSITTQQFAGIYLQTGILRLPQIVADILLGYLIYSLVHIYKPKKALFASSIFLFNPIVIYNSSFWGQMDSLNNLFLLLSLFLSIRKKHALSIMSFFISIYIKISLVFLLPLFLFIMYKNISHKKRFFSEIAYSILGLLALTLPLSHNPIAWFIHYSSSASLGEMQQITNFAFNFWWVIFKPVITIVGNQDLYHFSEVRLSGSPIDTTIFAGLPLRIWGLGLFIATSIPLYKGVYKIKNISPQILIRIISMSTLLGFIFLPRMHERYMYPFFPLFAAYIGLTKFHMREYILLSIFHLMNLYIVWHPMRLSFFSYELMTNRWLQWIISVFILTLSTYIYMRLIKTLSKN
jgi:dolichyl-phosphate-mannose-protein mannosyltransferase